MDVIVDGERNFEFTGEPESVLSVVAAAIEFLRERNRAIIAVTIDGQDVPADDLITALEGRTLDSVAALEVQSADVHALVNECLSSLEQALPDLPAACHSLAEVFQGEAPDEGYEPFQKLAEIWSHVKARETQIVHALDLDLEQIDVAGTPMKRIHEELNEFLHEAAEALQTNDTVLLGDLLEYELAPRAELEAQIVALLRAEAEKRAQ